MIMKRRYFLKISSLTTAGLPLSAVAKANLFLQPDPTLTADTGFELFVHPKNIHRPFVRWWWNGDRVTKEEVLRELDVMQNAGIGGVEINPIKWPETADPVGIPELQWGSDQWLDVVDAAVKGAKERGMICDMIIGSGWPFGGEFVPQAERSQIIIVGTKNLAGGERYSFARKELFDSVPPPSDYEKRINELFMLRLAPVKMDVFTAGIDLDGQLSQEIIHIDVPAGDHVFYYLVKVTGFQTVIQGAAGANGPVINHYEKTAVENYLNRFSDLLTKKLGPLSTYFRAFFTDSIELEGANWCHDLFEVFQQRKGYDLKSYFPYILFKVGGMGNAVHDAYGSAFSPEVQTILSRVRYDFQETRVQLFHERFIQTFVSWCVRNGVKSRMQAYGMDCHPLEASMLIDIPECETWIDSPTVEEFGENDKGRCYTMINKFVSSAAHLTGKQEISCEELTNLGQIFGTTLEQIKVTGDESNLSGVTHSVLHGFNYSPPSAPFPGWIRYGSYLNERNSWWPYFRLWADYKARVSSLFQNAVMQADIAVLHPLSDLVSRYGFQRDPFPQVSYPPYVHQVWEAIHQNGHGCDYISEKIIQQATVENGKFHFNSRTYHTLLLIEVETLRPETARAIEKFAEAGCKLIFVGKAPHLSPGLAGCEQEDKEVAGITAHILKKHTRTAGVVTPPANDLLSWFGRIGKRFTLVPPIVIDKPVNHISLLYYKNAERDIFFFTNYSAQKEHAFRVVFATKKTPWLWDAETGRRFLYPSKGSKELEIALGPSESRLLVFDDSNKGEVYAPFDVAGSKEIVMPGPWQLSLNHVNGTETKLLLDQLTDLRHKEEYKDFAGTITYLTTINMVDITEKMYLSLGHIYDISELEINGQPLGTKWYGHHLYNVAKVLQRGDNLITIKIVTTLVAYTESLKNNKAAKEWSRDRLFSPIGLDQPVKIVMANV